MRNSTDAIIGFCIGLAAIMFILSSCEKQAPPTPRVEPTMEDFILEPISVEPFIPVE